MMRTLFFFCCLFTVTTAALANGGAGRFVERLQLPSGQMIVVEEGLFEARSLGSFSIRLYAAASPQNETTFFLDGLVAARQGTVETVKLADIDCDGKSDIVVVTRSVGTGGYVSAYAFQYDDNTLRPDKTAENLAADVDPIDALQDACGSAKNKP